MDDKVMSVFKFILRNVLRLIIIYILSTTLLFLLFYGLKINISDGIFILSTYALTGLTFYLYLAIKPEKKNKPKKKKPRKHTGNEQKLSDEEPIRWS